jgi:hypothetical protein
MSLPASREQVKDYALRRLGYPVVEINVDDEQVEDRIDDALYMFQEYHHDAVEKTYLKHQMTQENKDNRYIPIVDAIIGIVMVFPFGGHSSTNSMFSMRYQFALNDLYNFTSTSIVPYTNMMRHVELMEEILIGQTQMRFNRHTNRLYLDINWDLVNVGDYIIVECYRILDPNTYTDVYGDRWFLRYVTALIKRQWGENLKKFDGIAMPGGVTFNGQKIWEEAVDEIKILEEQITTTWSMPATDMIG